MLNDRVYIVTGGTTGIGAGITAVLRGYGARVAAWRFEDCDVRDPAQVEAATAATVAEYGRLDGVVNNAGLTGPIALASFLTASPAHVDDMLATNLKGPIYCSQAFARHAVSAGQPGAIVHIASVGAYAAQEHAAVYCATKAALVSLTQGMALELAPHGIRVNAVAPGWVITQLSRGAREDPVRSAAIMARVPVGRWAEPAEIADPILFLCSDAARYMTGTVMPVDGGYTSVG